MTSVSQGKVLTDTGEATLSNIMMYLQDFYEFYQLLHWSILEHCSFLFWLLRKCSSTHTYILYSHNDAHSTNTLHLCIRCIRCLPLKCVNDKWFYMKDPKQTTLSNLATKAIVYANTRDQTRDADVKSQYSTSWTNQPAAMLFI